MQTVNNDMHAGLWGRAPRRMSRELKGMPFIMAWGYSLHVPVRS